MTQVPRLCWMETNNLHCGTILQIRPSTRSTLTQPQDYPGLAFSNS